MGGCCHGCRQICDDDEDMVPLVWVCGLYLGWQVWHLHLRQPQRSMPCLPRLSSNAVNGWVAWSSLAPTCGLNLAGYNRWMIRTRPKSSKTAGASTYINYPKYNLSVSPFETNFSLLKACRCSSTTPFPHVARGVKIRGDRPVRILAALHFPTGRLRRCTPDRPVCCHIHHHCCHRQFPNQ